MNNFNRTELEQVRQERLLSYSPPPGLLTQKPSIADEVTFPGLS